MQSYNEKKLVSTDMGNMEELKERFTALESDITHATIGKFPVKNDIIMVNGLKYRVEDSNLIEGTFTVKILKPTEDK